MGYPQPRADLARTLAFLKSLSEKVSFEIRYNLFKRPVAFIQCELLDMSPHLRQASRMSQRTPVR